MVIHLLNFLFSNLKLSSKFSLGNFELLTEQLRILIKLFICITEINYRAFIYLALRDCVHSLFNTFLKHPPPSFFIGIEILWFRVSENFKQVYRTNVFNDLFYTVRAELILTLLGCVWLWYFMQKR